MILGSRLRVNNWFVDVILTVNILGIFSIVRK